MSNGIRWTQEELTAYLRSFKADAGVAVPIADLEQYPEHGLAKTHEDKEVHPRFRIHIHSKRRRLADPDGISSKAAIDGITKAGIIGDDSADWIESVSFSQEVSKVEETVIEVWQVDEN